AGAVRSDHRSRLTRRRRGKPARARRPSRLARAREAVHGLEQLAALRPCLLGVPGRERRCHAVVHVLVEDAEGEAVERRRHGGDLREHVDAVAVVLDHPLDPAHLPLDAVQPLDERGLVLRVAVDAALLGAAHRPSSRDVRKRRRRRLFVTTNREEAAIAAAATIGSSRPATASGMAATLYTNAQKRLPLIVRSVLRARRMASAAARRSPETSVRSDASMATSVPVPIASPRSAWASAGASLTPSPTIATVRPSRCRRAISAALPSGSTSASTRSIPTSRAT